MDMQNHATEYRKRVPDILILGDSISIDYMPYVAEALGDAANIQRPAAPDGKPINCASTAYSLRHIREWIAGTDWKIIHFNWGLHDIAYRHPASAAYGNRDKINGVRSTAPEAYEQNLVHLVNILKGTNARLIWASTTYVPEGEAGRFQGDEVKYNRIASRVMQANGIRINDLHSLSATIPAMFFQAPGDVHYTAEGSKILAKQVAETLRDTLQTG